MGLDENFCKKRKNKFAFCVKMSTLALGIFFYFALREFLKKFSKIKPSFFYERGLLQSGRKESVIQPNYNPKG